MNTSSRLLCFVSLFVISWILLQAPPDFDRYAPVLEILNDPNASRCLIQYKYSASGKPSDLGCPMAFKDFSAMFEGLKLMGGRDKTCGAALVSRL